MKNNLIEKNITYLGINDPKTKSQIEFEILGLKTVIAESNKKIAELNQALCLVSLILEEQNNDSNNS